MHDRSGGAVSSNWKGGREGIEQNDRRIFDTRAGYWKSSTMVRPLDDREPIAPWSKARVWLCWTFLAGDRRRMGTKEENEKHVSLSFIRRNYTKRLQDSCLSLVG